MLNLMENAGFSQLHFCTDQYTGLRAIIAIQSTDRGPAMGGCRFIPYASDKDAITDAMRLAKGMSYKSAIAGLPHGGGKAVILMPDKPFDRRALLEAFGRFIDNLSGQYITAIDSGTSMADMDIINRETRWVTCTSKFGDPSAYTAAGVVAGIKAALKHKTGSSNLHQCQVNIQGLGNVGFSVAELLHQAGAELTVTDLNPQLVEKAAVRFNARCVHPEQIYQQSGDIFCPCGLGAILNPTTVPQLKVGIVAGSANNQLADDDIGDQLFQRNILYAPDYVINAGGLIFVSMSHDGFSATEIDQHIQSISQTLTQIFSTADQQQCPPHQIANLRAEQIINETNQSPEL